MTKTEKYLKTFFDEKSLEQVFWTINGPTGVPNHISNFVVVEHIMGTCASEQEQIANILRKIDFHNGDVNHFLKHLAKALAL